MEKNAGFTFKFMTIPGCIVLFVHVVDMENNRTVQDQTCIVGYVTSVLGQPALKEQISFM